MDDLKIFRVLQCFKGLTKVQAKALLEIIKHPKQLTKNEINKLLNKKNICSGNAGYKIIESLEEKNVLFAKNSLFEPINCGLLVNECKSASELLGEEIEGIKLSFDWNKTDPLTRSQILESHVKIIHEISKLKDQGFEIELFFKDNDKDHHCWDLIKSQIDNKLIKGIHNCIAFKGQKDKVNSSGVILLSKRQQKTGGEDTFYGHMIFDDNLYDLFKKGVKK
ncbi:hypothetical protein ACFL1H_02155 [Nanoarchaeota archaeon]